MRELIKQVAEDYLKDPSYFIVDVIVKGSGGRSKVLILLDGDEGVNIDDCADLSRAVGMHIETEELIEHAYILEVSSPGLDHPLMLNRQYKKNINRKLKLRLKDETEITGLLESVSEDEIGFKKEKKNKKKVTYQEVSIPFEAIEKANVLVSFK